MRGKMSVKVSIIIPVYNKEEYIEKCLQSVFAQTLQDIEIIIIDDGSTDNSAEICKRYLSDSRVRYIFKHNEGLAAARQDGIEYSTGEYIGFVDSDDWIEPEMFLRMYNVATSNNADVVMCGMYKDESQKTSEYLLHGVYNKSQIENIIIPGFLGELTDQGIPYIINYSNCTKLFLRKTIIENQAFFDKEILLSEDLPFSIRTALSARIYVSICNEYYYHYRLDHNEVSLSRGYKKDFWKKYEMLIQKLNKIVEESNLTHLNYNMQLCTFFLSELVVKNEYSTNQIKRKEKVLKLNELAQSELIKKALQFVPKNKLNSHYRIIYDALMCNDGGQMYRYLKKNKAYVVPKENRRIIIQKKLKTVKRKALKYKAIAKLNDKVRHRG